MDNGEYIKMRDKVNTLIDNSSFMEKRILPDGMGFGLITVYEFGYEPAFVSVAFYDRDSDFTRVSKVFGKVNTATNVNLFNLDDIHEAANMEKRCEERYKVLEDHKRSVELANAMASIDAAVDKLNDLARK